MLNPGDQVPIFQADSTQGDINLADLLGQKPIVLIFYPMDETPGCTKQLCAVRDAESEYAERGAIVLGVNSASKDSHEKFAAKQGYRFPLVVDQDGVIRRLYGVGKSLGFLTQQRTVFVIDLEGRISFAEKGLPSTEDILAAIDKLH
jgi:peroxiredoxin Q/BCP